MTSVERARRFLESKSRVIALTVVPLASLVHLATPAQATIAFNGGTCNVSSGGNASLNAGSCSGGQYGTGTDGNTGVTIYGNGNVIMSGGGGGSLIFDTTGTANNGSYSGSIPFSWDFTNTTSTGGEFVCAGFASCASGGTFSWSLVLDLNGSQVFTSGGTLTSTVEGSTSVNLASLGDISSYEVKLTVTESGGNSGDTISTTIPSGTSLDLDNTPAPEPATVGLTASALAFLGSLAWWRRRKSA